jgi:hypothetical protein
MMRYACMHAGAVFELCTATPMAPRRPASTGSSHNSSAAAPTAKQSPASSPPSERISVKVDRAAVCIESPCLGSCMHSDLITAAC